MDYEVEPVDARIRVVIQSELVANESLPDPDGDPRTARALKSPLEPEEDLAQGPRLRLVHRTRRSGLRVAVAADHVVDGPRAPRRPARATRTWPG
ncbi:Glycosyl hydrolase OS=Streptomyces fumanus OX=67302 GN=GCM10018772_26510 PE=3 SV=1 [Streptomyces fumanus]